MGTHLRQITHVVGAATQPDWSPDGRTIVFEWDLPNERGARIGVVDADGKHLRSLPKSAAGCPGGEASADGQPNVTADGKRVVYERFDCAHQDDALFVRSLDGSDVRRITAARPDGASEPNTAPDGRHLSFVRFDKGVEYQQALTVSDLDGGHQHDLVPPSVDVAVKTGWAPDSSRIVFTRDANPDPGTGVLQANIVTVAADGSGLRQLTHYRGGNVSAFAGSYSPDGRSIVYRLENDQAGTSAVWTMSPDGGHRREVFHRDGLRARGIDWGVR